MKPKMLISNFIDSPILIIKSRYEQAGRGFRLQENIKDIAGLSFGLLLKAN